MPGAREDLPNLLKEWYFSDVEMKANTHCSPVVMVLFGGEQDSLEFPLQSTCGDRHHFLQQSSLSQKSLPPYSYLYTQYLCSIKYGKTLAVLR